MKVHPATTFADIEDLHQATRNLEILLAKRYATPRLHALTTRREYIALAPERSASPVALPCQRFIAVSVGARPFLGLD